MSEFQPSLIIDKFIDRKTLMDCIGLDTKDLARTLWESHQKAVAEAVKAERERCAGIVEAFIPHEELRLRVDIIKEIRRQGGA